ncbi:unnamed protein product [Calypogeia fissa]
MGGHSADKNDGDEKGCNVYVLDVAGQRDWQKCANMPEPRDSYGCAVVDGKIYVTGGRYAGSVKSARESLVYDPEANVWSLIRPMKHTRCEHLVLAAGEELLVHGGEYRHPDDNFYLDGKVHLDYNPFELEGKDPLLVAEVYHAGKDEWRLVEPFYWDSKTTAASCTAQGKLYMANLSGIYRNDIDTDGNYSWIKLHSFSFTDEGLADYEIFEVRAIEVVKDELLAVVYWRGDGWSYLTVLHQSIGFGSKKEEIIMEKINIVEYRLTYPDMYAIEL